MLAGSGSGLATCLRMTIKPARAPPGLRASRSTGLPASMRALGARSIRRTPCMVPATMAPNGPSQASGIRANGSRNTPAESGRIFEGPLSDGGFNRWMQRTRDCASRRSVADEALRLGTMQGAGRKEDQSERGKPVHVSCVEMTTRCRSAAMPNSLSPDRSTIQAVVAVPARRRTPSVWLRTSGAAWQPWRDSSCLWGTVHEPTTASPGHEPRSSVWPPGGQCYWIQGSLLFRRVDQIDADIAPLAGGIFDNRLQNILVCHIRTQR
jgi:hypothetical protein